MLKNFIKYNRILLLITVFFSAILNAILLINDNSFLFFLLPGLTWGLALCLPIYRFLPEKLFSLILFTNASLALWFFMLMLGTLIGLITFLISPIFVFPFLGVISAFSSYLIYSKLVLFHFNINDAIICSALGFLALFLNSLTEPTDKIFLEGKTVLFFYWQFLVGIGHVIAYLRFRLNYNKTSAI